jgi:ABC-type multidrug transport system ATPase subunit
LLQEHVGAIFAAVPRAAARGARVPPTSRATFTREQADRLGDHMAEQGLPMVLTALRQAAQANRDRELHDFVTLTRASLADTDRMFGAGSVSLEARNTAHARLREAALAEIRAREAADAPQEAPGEEAEPPEKVARRRAPLLRCQGLSKRYPRGFSLPEVTFDLEQGEIAGVVGFNGAGKTTLLRMLAHDLAITEGKVEIGDQEIGGRRLRTKVAMVPQTPPQWMGTLLAYLRQQAALYGFDTEASNTDMVDTAVELVGLGAHLGMRWDELSGGYRTRAAIAAAVVAHPGLLVLDEPLAALDPRAQQRLLRELVIRAENARTAIVISSQHVPEVESIADVMIALDDGKVEIRSAGREPAEVGRLFEVGVRGASKDLDGCLRRLEDRGEIEGFVLGEKSAVVRFASAKGIPEAMSALQGLDVCHVRDISGSMLSLQYVNMGTSATHGDAS